MDGLVRPRQDRVIAGVCAGLAYRFGMSPFAMRLIFVLSCILPGAAVHHLHRAVGADALRRLTICGSGAA